jgi:hypothetical protein
MTPKTHDLPGESEPVEYLSSLLGSVSANIVVSIADMYRRFLGIPRADLVTSSTRITKTKSGVTSIHLTFHGDAENATTLRIVVHLEAYPQ